MKSYTKYILFFSFLALGLPLSGQVNLKTTAAKYPPTLNAADQKKVVTSVQNLLNEYAEAATLLDATKRQVTSTSINRFRGLFNPTARVIKDYEEYIQGESVDIRTYTDQVFNRLLRQGLKVKIESAKLVEIKLDPAGYWVAFVELDKSFYNAATAGQEVKDISSGRFMKQMIQIDIKTNDLERAKIAGIKCIGCSTAIVDDFVRYVGPSIGIFTGSFNPSLSSFWNNNHASSSLSTSAEPGFSFGVDFLTNAFTSKGATKKNLFLTAGLRYSIYRMSTGVNDFAIAPYTEMTPGSIALPYSRSARDISFEEKLNASVLEIPLGVAYRLKKGIKSDFLLGVKLIPSFVLSASGDIKGTGTYDAEISESMWRLLEEGATDMGQIDEATRFGPFQSGENLPISENSDPSTAGFLLSAQISPTYYLHFSEEESSWSLLVGLDLNFHLGSFLAHDENVSEDILKFNDDYSSSFLQHYTDGMSGVTFGLRIGLHHRLTSRP